MHMLSEVNRIARNQAATLIRNFFPVYWKKHHELSYWKHRKKAEGDLGNAHYEYFYTTHFGLEPLDYFGKVIMDIGCGPRGSLEWASMAARRIGLDPLVNDYRRLGADRHRMQYIASPSERIPLKDGECDAVFSFNSLDHVEDPDQTLREIKRVVRPHGIFLLLVEVNHSPTECEPHHLTPSGLLSSLAPEFKCESLQVYAPVFEFDMYRSIRADHKLVEPATTTEVGFLSAKFRRVASLPEIAPS